MLNKEIQDRLDGGWVTMGTLKLGILKVARKCVQHPEWIIIRNKHHDGITRLRNESRVRKRSGKYIWESEQNKY